jgi:hypothetical protein
VAYRVPHLKKNVKDEQNDRENQDLDDENDDVNQAQEQVRPIQSPTVRIRLPPTYDYSA